MNTFLSIVIFLGSSWFFILSSIIAATEHESIKKKHKAGTHDYYGNKLGENND